MLKNAVCELREQLYDMMIKNVDSTKATFNYFIEEKTQALATLSPIISLTAVCISRLFSRNIAQLQNSAKTPNQSVLCEK